MSRVFLSIAVLGACAVFAADVAPWAKEVAQFRADREARLKSPTGWLSVAGLFWLRDGAMTVGSDPKSDIALPASAPKHVGTLRLQSGAVQFEPVAGANVMVSGRPATKMTLKPDTDEHPDTMQAGPITMTIIKRMDRVGVRMRDPDAATRKNFTGLKWYPAAQKWRVKAKWVAYTEPKKIRITNILGMTDDEPAPGYAEFTVNGQKLRLEPVEEGDSLAFMFKDATTGKTTYQPGRFLDTDMPKDGYVILDFNKAYNPPCAFIAYATCPLPPKQNTLAVAVEAGERSTAIATPVGNNGVLVLASRSPRRAELLTAAGIPFVVRAADIDETPLTGESPRDYVTRIAAEKARAISDAGIVLAADTTVVLRDEILGKPVDRADAIRMLSALAGQRHEVLTAICLRRGGVVRDDVASTTVWFGPMSGDEIEEYVASGEPMDKAGAYAIQGIASRWIERIEGSYTNVVGLPVALVFRHLREMGFEHAG